jgi:hypothetical protein
MPANVVRIMWVPVLLSVLYTGRVFWQRHTADRVAENPPYPLAAYGNSVRILQFYSRKREIAPDEKAVVCYGVVNATAVRLDPPVERVWPVLSRCFEVTPAKSTRYTLTAEGPQHRSRTVAAPIGASTTTVSESIEIAVMRK